MPENLVSRDGFSRPVPRQSAHLHTQAESGAYLRDSSRVPRRRPFMKPPYATGSVPSLSGHAIAYRWRSLPRVRRHRASKSQGSSERVLPWQVTTDQLIFASLSHTHFGHTDMVITYSRVWINRVRLPILLVVSWTGKIIFPCPRACLRIWSRETGSVVLSRVSLLISILRLNLVLTYGIPSEFRGGVHL